MSIVLFIPYSVSLIDKRIIAHYHLADWQKVFYKKEKIGWRSTRYLLFCTFLQREPIALTTTDVDYFIERLEKEEMYKKLNIFAHPMFAFVITVIIALIGAMLAKFSLGVLLQCLAIIIIVIMVLVCYLIFYGAIANINDLKLFLFWYKEEIASHEKFEDKSISEKIKKETAIA
ncbi:hypothetical protein [Fangia hongkongensis]|uniref:hypothetical protein n=1 Tax=Fangia hongkongensis TaxID=270495 RepID=UPI0012B52C1A|nr:hypothetical protein [Fangia hongkongensis]MBK2125831.1 hypothetical protein [Fangia hongkongensis]